MYVSARTNHYEPVAAEVARSRSRVQRLLAAGQTGQFVGDSYATLAPGSRRTVNEALADPTADKQTFPTSSVSSALAILDITTLLEAGIARAVPSLDAAAASAPADLSADATDAPSSIDQLLTRMLAGH